MEAIPVSIKATSAVSRRGAEFAEKGLILGKVTYYKGDVFFTTETQRSPFDPAKSGTQGRQRKPVNWVKARLP